jgi:hypothetical protein
MVREQAMTDGPGNPETVLRPLIASLARPARAAADMGVEFDLAGPRVVRWLILTTFEASCMPSAERSLEETLVLAGNVEERGSASTRPKRRVRNQQWGPLITWDDLVASAAPEA